MNCILMEAEPEYVEFLNKRFQIAAPVNQVVTHSTNLLGLFEEEISNTNLSNLLT
jgi:hypothetical protein